ncbi:MAG: hypothetical protein WA964_16970 [Ilumatobacter sp.]|uniref:hypothetical protein n=1 Tax=Ilumatobacter sp. TaxID=1967498 RepID=UPI003C7258EE
MTAVFVTIMIVVANVMGAGMAYPQASKLIRTGNTRGVSGVWAGVSLTMNIWWLAYGLANDLWGLVPVSGVAAVLYVAIIVAYLRSAGRSAAGGVLLGAFVLGMVPAPFLAVGGWAVAGLAIGLCYGMQLVPAVAAACRTRELHGVAPSTWIMAWVEAVIWVGYGLYVVDSALLAGGVSGAILTSVILGRLMATGHEPFRIRRPARAMA